MIHRDPLANIPDTRPGPDEAYDLQAQQDADDITLAWAREHGVTDPRELRILVLYSRGMSALQISKALHIRRSVITKTIDKCRAS